jgi:hypothetical protein
MEDFADFMSVFMLLVVAFLSTVAKPLFKKLNGEGEASDARSEEEEETMYEEVTPIEEVYHIQESRPAEAVHRKKHSSRKVQKTPSPTPPVQPEAAKNGSGDSPLRIRTKSDARRAFLYSEIFNRKYE